MTMMDDCEMFENLTGESSGDHADQARHEDVDRQLEFNSIFPVEIKTQILECLPFDALMSASSVCHQWNDIINASRHLDQVVYQFSTFSRLAQPSHEPFNRNYVNFVIKELPTEEEFRAKFEPIREKVKSIKIYVKDSISRVKNFLDSFTNLSSLELVHFGYFNDMTNEDDAAEEGFNLLKLQHFAVECESMRFAIFALTLIRHENKLKSFKFELHRGLQALPFREIDLMRRLRNLLNSQPTLKTLKLHLSDHKDLSVLSRDDADRFLPRFDLENFTLTGSTFVLMNLMDENDEDEDDEDEREVVGFFLRKLLGTCIYNCKSLHIDFAAQDIPDIVEALSIMERLEELSMEYDCHRTSAYGQFNALLKSNVIRGRWKKLTLGEHFIKHWGNSAGWESNGVMKTILSKQYNSLEELHLRGFVSCDNTVWKMISAMPKLRVLQAVQPAKTALNNFNGSQIESLIITKKSSTVNKLIADGQYWESFRTKNPNFKSIVFQEK